jgi:lipoprotein-releasing system permease protein
MSIKWVWYIAARYIFKKQKKTPSAALSILGIATGVFALIVIIAVMNGFQLSFIESILEISSYHLRAGPLPPEYTDDARAALLPVAGIEAAVPFREFQGLVRGRWGGQQAVVVRGLPPDAPAMDTAMAQRLEFEDGSGCFDLKNGRNVLLSAVLARRIGVGIDSEITLFSIPSIFSVGNTEGDDENSGSMTFTVTGIFSTGFYEFDTSWAFMHIDSAAVFSETDPVLGIKLKNRFHDQRTLELARKSLEGKPGLESAEFSSWRDYNRSFFGALRTEKLFMFILVGLIFIVVGLNIYQAQRRAVLERREETGLLRAIGGGERAVRMIFVFDGAIIGFSGAVAGLIPGLLIAGNTPQFFTGIEIIVNFFINIFNVIAGFFNAGGVRDFAIFSPAVFYIKEIPSRIIPGEAVLIFMFGFFSALFAAWFASRKVSRVRPAEVLRYE